MQTFKPFSLRDLARFEEIFCPSPQKWYVRWLFSQRWEKKGGKFRAEPESNWEFCCLDTRLYNSSGQNWGRPSRHGNTHKNACACVFFGPRSIDITITSARTHSLKTDGDSHFGWRRFWVLVINCESFSTKEIFVFWDITSAIFWCFIVMFDLNAKVNF
jgi:hypothetical protein